MFYLIIIDTVFAAIDYAKVDRSYIGRTKIDIFQECYFELIKEYQSNNSRDKFEDIKGSNENIEFVIRKQLSMKYVRFNHKFHLMLGKTKQKQYQSLIILQSCKGKLR